MRVYDLEISKYDWLVGIKDKDGYTQIHNDYGQLKAYYEKNKDDIWAGFNSAHYDSILLKAMLLESSPQKIKELSDDIVANHKEKVIIRRLGLNKIQLYDFDVLSDGVRGSLKEIEGYWGREISESSVDFNLDRPWTKEEYEEMAKYNRDDLDATWEIATYAMTRMRTKMILIKEYNLPKSMISGTNAQICAEILGADYKKFGDGLQTYDPSIAPIELNKYKECLDFYTNMPQMDYKQSLNIELAGVPHTLAAGGLHGAIPSFFFVGTLWLVDVASYYPNMMINFNLTPRSQKDPNAFKELVHKRIAAKHKVAEAKKNHTEDQLTPMEHAMPNALKLPINTVSGCMKAKFSKLYDERNNNWMCITGQLLMVDLIEHLEPYCKLVQSNTDGIVIIPYNHRKCDEIIQHWMDKTGLVLEKTVANAIYQKDVNNYVLLNENGSIKVKGGYVAQYFNDDTWYWSVRRNLEIIDKAIVDFLIYDTPVEETIVNPENNILKYQIVKKLGGMYTDPMWEIDGKLTPLPNRCNRIFPAKDNKYGKVKKRKWEKSTWDNVESIPEHCLVINDEIRGKTLADFIDQIDTGCYIWLAKSKIADYILLPHEKTRGKKYDPDEDWANVLKKLGREAK